MHPGEISGDPVAEYCFREGGYCFTLSKDGVKCTSEKEGEEELFYAYDDVRLYRAIYRKRASSSGKDELYLTVPVPSLSSYNRYRFRAGNQDYVTHEFTADERGRIERAIGEFDIPVVNRKKDASPISVLYKTFREDGGIAHRIVAVSVFLIVALVIGAVIMYLLNYFLHVATDKLAIVFGIFCLPCLAIVIIKSQELGSKVKIYDKGVYLKIRSKSGYGGTTSPFAIEKAYITWEEIECVERVQKQVDYTVHFRLGYCDYSLPDFNGLYEYILKRFPEKCI